MTAETIGTYPSVPDPAGWRRRGRELAARFDQALRDVGRALDVDPMVLASPSETPSVAVEAVTWRCIGALRRLELSPPTPETGWRIAQLVALLTELRELAFDLHQRDVERRTRHMSDCATGLALMREVTDPADLIDAVCAEIAVRCGFNRVVLSRVEDGVWKPWMGYFTEPTQYEAWFDAWVDQSVTLEDPTPERQLIIDPRPQAVVDTAAVTVSKEIVIDSAQSDSYVVSPIMRGAEVVGFVHADHWQRRRVDLVDRDVLWAFTEGFGHVYERAVLLGRVRNQRARLRDAQAAGARAMDDRLAGRTSFGSRAAAEADSAPAVTGREPSLTGLSMLSRPVRPGALPGLSGLTEREGDVLALMAAGGSNAAIAERLGIGEATVKSHVQRVLRKLGVANRTQAVGLVHGLAGERAFRP